VSLYARLAALAVILLALAGVAWKLHHSGYVAGKAEIQAQWDAERVQLKAETQAQADRNRDLQRASELRYTVQAGVRERVIIETITEVRHETANLAACVLTPAARGLLQRAADCASGDTPSACGADQPVPAAIPAR
jgi:hypothetical protein